MTDPGLRTNQRLDDDVFDVVPELLHFDLASLTEVLEGVLEASFVAHIILVCVFILNELL